MEHELTHGSNTTTVHVQGKLHDSACTWRGHLECWPGFRHSLSGHDWHVHVSTTCSRSRCAVHAEQSGACQGQCMQLLLRGMYGCRCTVVSTKIVTKLLLVVLLLLLLLLSLWLLLFFVTSMQTKIVLVARVQRQCRETYLTVAQPLSSTSCTHLTATPQAQKGSIANRDSTLQLTLQLHATNQFGNND